MLITFTQTVTSYVPVADMVLQALRLLLACAHVSSEEAGLEMLAYEFFEQVCAHLLHITS